MLCDLQDAKEAIVDMCRETGMRSFKVTNPMELMGSGSPRRKESWSACSGTILFTMLEKGMRPWLGI
jgi:hypothetical protein